MNEAQRLQYLEALDITQWVSNVPLVYAKETEFYQPEIVQQAIQDPQATSIETAEAVNSVDNNSQQAQSLLQNQTSDLQKQTSQQNPKQETAVTEAAISHVSITETSITETLAPKTNINKNTNKNQAPIFTCAIQMQGKRGQFLILADLTNDAGKITAQEQTLLNNIGRAIEDLYSNKSTTPILPEQFKWPLFESHFNAQHIDQSQQAAEESARAFIQSKLKRYHVPYVLILGERAKHLFIQQNDSNTSSPESTQFIFGAALQHMLADSAAKPAATLKAQLWQQLLNTLS